MNRKPRLVLLLSWEGESAAARVAGIVVARRATLQANCRAISDVRRGAARPANPRDITPRTSPGSNMAPTRARRCAASSAARDAVARNPAAALCGRTEPPDFLIAEIVAPHTSRAYTLRVRLNSGSPLAARAPRSPVRELPGPRLERCASRRARREPPIIATKARPRRAERLHL